jgi:hypothetical protein
LLLDRLDEKKSNIINQTNQSLNWKQKTFLLGQPFGNRL